MQTQLEIWKRFVSCEQMQPQFWMWKRFIRSLLVVYRCSLSLGSGRGLLEVYFGRTDAASAGDLEEVF